MDLMMINAHFDMMTDVGASDRPDGSTQPQPLPQPPTPNPQSQPDP
jgi:hypothetical protein